MSEALTVDDLTFALRRSPRRRTVEIVVDRDGTLRIAAPEDTAEAAIADYVRDKRFWVYTKLAEKDLLHQPTNPKQYVSGEGFEYLGRRYRLLLVARQDQPLNLVGGRFRLLRSEAPRGRAHFVRWYTNHARPWLADRMSPWARRLGVSPHGVDVRDLGYRWGSCGKHGTVNFHWATILAPPSVIDYIIVHELAHLLEPHHTPDFWLRVERAMPDFPHRRQRLAELGVGYRL